jgi:internalin A
LDDPATLGLAKIREAEVNGTTELDLNMAFFGKVGKDLTRLAGLTNLKKLHLSWNQLTDLTPLKGLTNLEYLDLSLNDITDLSPLAGLTNLTWLDLSNNEITDVTPLAGLTNLKKLQLGASLRPRDQIEMLKKALPDCIIE